MTVARIAGPPALLAIVATLALAAYLVAFQGSRGPALHIWLLTIGGLVMWTCLRVLAAALPTAGASAFDSVRDRPVEPASKLYDVIEIEGAILDAEWSPGGMEHRLRPLLRKIAASRLVERHQIDLETDAAAAHRILGDELWALIDPEAQGQAAPAPDEIDLADSTPAGTADSDPATSNQPPIAGTRHEKGRRGIPRATIRRAIDVLEAL